MTRSLVSDDVELIAAIHQQRLASWADHDDAQLVERAAATCRTIGTSMAALTADVLDLLDARGVRASADTAARPRQRHDVIVRVSHHDDALRAADVLESLGFERWERWSGGARRSFARFGSRLTVARTAEHSAVVRLEWSRERAASRIRHLIRSVFRPTQGDWQMVSLPEPLWWAYSVVRPVRLTLERLGLRDAHAAGLGPFLATPDSLLDGLFEVADIAADDVVVDIGCGDGRIAVEAARRCGCRAIGIDNDAALADHARQRARAAGVDERVSIVTGEARDYAVNDATVVFVFLPVGVVSDVVEHVGRRLGDGARIVVHEQNPLSFSSPQSTRSVAIVADDAVTVAHLLSPHR